ncbi:bacterial pre-peptidase C-terminal domain family protein [Calothrix sp. NIES-4071]|nr:bacterial pre-peptidase C-terminal domain family protein [Calothrix sp. NIES-4071]BAZ61916.1 bacterial pre-peptidase C-terminal domain family protein [Calothrix sp. NIES-4105]
MNFVIQIVIALVAILINQINVLVSLAATPSQVYNPILLPMGKEIKDKLTKSDFPTGEGGFARDYIINLRAGDQIVIDLKSDSFDTIVTLIGAKGVVVGENDDAAEGTTNSLLFERIAKDGNYIVRVRSFGTEPALGAFTLKVTRLRAE